ncbi:MAG: MAPEG family protein [Xanthomonadales bacterium]|nr:MAPEG family protein [Xanthomonadales bacterium]
MTVEIQWLLYVALFTALQWVPYILNQIAVRGLVDAVGYPAEPKPLADWAQRAKAAHYNSVENLVVFAALIVVAHLSGITSGAIQTACMVYFWARVAHYALYVLGVPGGRTVTFAVGWFATIFIGWQILAA